MQSGCGRTGSWFAFEQHGIVPDVIVASKAAGGLGMPVALILYDERLDTWEPGAHTGTFRGNQVAFAAGLKAMEIIQRDGILDNVRELGDVALASLQQLADRHSVVAEARGSGLMLGFEMVDPLTGDPNGDAARKVQRLALERGLIVDSAGVTTLSCGCCRRSTSHAGRSIRRSRSSPRRSRSRTRPGR